MEYVKSTFGDKVIWRARILPQVRRPEPSSNVLACQGKSKELSLHFPTEMLDWNIRAQLWFQHCVILIACCSSNSKGVSAEF